MELPLYQVALDARIAFARHANSRFRYRSLSFPQQSCESKCYTISQGSITARMAVQIDSFSAVPFHGNPAGVVLLDSASSAAISAELRQKIAAEMNLSETAFVEIIDASSSGANFSNSRFLDC